MKWIWCKTLITFGAILMALSAGTAEAQSNNSSSLLGIGYGISVPDADNTNPRFLTALTGTAFLASYFSFGGYYYLPGAEEGHGSRDFSYSMAGLHALYHIAHEKGTTFFGLRAGMTKLQEHVNNSDIILSPYHYGIMAGSDYFLLEKVSFGVEGFLVHCTDSTTTAGGTPYREDPFNMIGFLATIKLAL